MMKSLLVVILLAGCLERSPAQNLDPGLEIGLLGGLTFYSGDLTPQEFSGYFEELRPAAGLFARYTLNRFLAARLGLTYAVAAGDDQYSANPERELSFRTPIYEAALTVEFSPFVIGTPQQSPLLVPYLAAGVGVFHFRPETRFEGEWIALQPLGTEAQGLPGYPDTYSLTQINIPMGGGLRFIINDTWTLGLEFMARKLFTDHLDDVSDAEVNYRDLIQGNGVLAARLSNKSIDPSATDDFDFTYTRGGPGQDWFYTAALTVSIRLWQGTSRSRGKFPAGPVCPGF